MSIRGSGENKAADLILLDQPLMAYQTSHTDWARSLHTEFRTPSLNGSHKL
jgi:hypothetical protein